MKIYTKRGDQGQTTLVNGSPISKSDLRLNTYGTVDELNSHLGLLTSMLTNEAKLKDLNQQILEIQNWLFNLGSQLACDDQKMAAQLPSLNQEPISFLENWMDQWDSELPVLKNFILPGGHLASAQAQVCRTVARRAERLCVELSQQTELKFPAVIFLNRLSDYFFVAARLINHRLGIESLIWKP